MLCEPMERLHHEFHAFFEGVRERTAGEKDLLRNTVVHSAPEPGPDRSVGGIGVGAEQEVVRMNEVVGIVVFVQFRKVVCPGDPEVVRFDADQKELVVIAVVRRPVLVAEQSVPNDQLPAPNLFSQARLVRVR
ncbi:hypothetical protein B7C42_08135 [Nocardia cerradoensis]|uniref:Uncharacterized protein n=1 Tax=Nocardia cerradoensis TaxID=85688 RepID=A0A231GTB8_9NOCA|nr:hypothetical protein B7C42_08135 [Nocardia cerradoensis]